MAEQVPAVLPVGGRVIAIIPQTLEETYRLATWVFESGTAPHNLIKSKTPQQAKAAITICISAGAELGLPPSASLRMLKVINNIPSLDGEGMIAVIRMRGVAKSLKLGFEPGKDALFGDDAYGWCEAVRKDNKEVQRIEFTVDDAKRAGLWDERAKVERYGKTVDNDAPWFRYPKRMLQWRAAGYCLRELFADILTGMPSEYEAREIIGEIETEYDAGTNTYKPTTTMPPSPPKKAEDEPKTEGPETGGDDSEDVKIEPITDADVRATFLNWLEAELATANALEEVEAIWDAAHVEAKLSGDDMGLADADDMRAQAVRRVTPE